VTAATWRALERKVREQLDGAVDDPAHDARRIVEQASGWEGAEGVLHGDDTPSTRQRQLVATMTERRRRGEPLQYVLGRWGFRTLDLFVDRRVLIPRPETEVVADAAVAALRGRSHRALAVDLGTGSGAIGLSLAVELWPDVDVWATDRSRDALAVARANLAALGHRASAVRLVEGDWFAALPRDLVGRVDVIVSNPPYVAEGDPLPPDVRNWEPRDALIAGPTGIEDIAAIIAAAPRWLASGGAVVLEIGETQGAAVKGLAEAAGFDASIHPDHAGRDRVLMATARQ
jgi:release factor glutamine methyltransferase